MTLDPSRRSNHQREESRILRINIALWIESIDRGNEARERNRYLPFRREHRRPVDTEQRKAERNLLNKITETKNERERK